MTNFHVGMKVVCISDSGFSRKHAVVPMSGKVFTIADIQSDIPHPFGVGLAFCEINALLPHGKEAWFLSTRFRPVQKTSIDIFTAILTPAQKQTVSA